MFGKKKEDRLVSRLEAIKTARPITTTAPKRSKKARAQERVSAYKFGHVRLPDGNIVKCIVKDMSANGARIVLEGANILPPTVGLSVGQAGLKKTATVVWQNELEVGLYYP